MEDVNFYTRISPENEDIIIKDAYRTFSDLLPSSDIKLEYQHRLKRLLITYFSIHKEYEYYQGFHDIVAILSLLNFEDEEVLYYIDKLSNVYFHKYLTDKNFSCLLLREIESIVDKVASQNHGINPEHIRLCCLSKINS